MTIKDRLDTATSYARDRASTVRSTAGDALSSARQRATDLGGSARERTARARQGTAQGIDANPVAALLGGLALGALAAAVLPRTRKEDELLGDLGGKINDTARSAAQAAKDAGRSKLDELGVNKDNAIDKARELAQTAAGVVKESATAAASTVKSS